MEKNMKRKIIMDILAVVSEILFIAALVFAFSVIEDGKRPCETHSWVRSDYARSTCTERGGATFTCKVCGAVEEREFDLKEHTFVLDEEISPSCEEDGISAPVVCRDCGFVRVEGEVIPASGHDMRVVKIYEPTCVSEGYTLLKCFNCDSEERTAFLPVIAHEEYVEEGKPSTCTEEGFTSRTICVNCGTVIKESEIIPIAEHDFIVSEKQASCLESGYTETRCSYCDYFSREEKEALGHAPELYSSTAPTCENSGDEIYRCSRCGKITEEKKIPPTGHSTYSEHKDATCTTPETELIRCRNCDYFEERPISKAKGHKYVEKYTPEGKRILVCEECGDVVEIE